MFFFQRLEGELYSLFLLFCFGVQILVRKSDCGATIFVQKLFDTFRWKIRDLLREAAQVYNVHTLIFQSRSVFDCTTSNDCFLLKKF